MNFGFCNLRIFSPGTGREPRGNRPTRMGKVTIKTGVAGLSNKLVHIVYVFSVSLHFA